MNLIFAAKKAKIDLASPKPNHNVFLQKSRPLRFCVGHTPFPKILHTLLRNHYQPAVISQYTISGPSPLPSFCPPKIRIYRCLKIVSLMFLFLNDVFILILANKCVFRWSQCIFGNIIFDDFHSTYPNLTYLNLT